MINKRTVCIVTGSRAEYGLLFWLMTEIARNNELTLQIIVTGMHLSTEFGLTYKQIENDGFKINKKVEMLLSSDTPVGISKSIGVGVIGFADAFSELKPDLLVVLGDRFEIFSAVSAALIALIPIAHVHGGEVTEGAFDDSLRHSISKMSHLHFTASEVYRNRVIQLGESPERVFNVGAPGIDNINRLKLLTRSEFEQSINFKLNCRNVLVTFHPSTLDSTPVKEQISNLISVLDELKDTNLLFTKANADTGGRIINEVIDEYVQSNSSKAIVFKSLGQVRYLSALKHVDLVIGNSSSGIIEAPSFNVGTINVGERQKGRLKAESIIDCDSNKNSISDALEEVFSNGFQVKLKEVLNLYGSGGASNKILEVIRDYELDNIIKKKFYDLPF